MQHYAAFAEGAASRHESDTVAFVSVFLFLMKRSPLIWLAEGLEN